jgi:hypothetical protein
MISIVHVDRTLHITDVEISRLLMLMERGVHISNVEQKARIKKGLGEDMSHVTRFTCCTSIGPSSSNCKYLHMFTFNVCVYLNLKASLTTSVVHTYTRATSTATTTASFVVTSTQNATAAAARVGASKPYAASGSNKFILHFFLKDVNNIYFIFVTECHMEGDTDDEGLDATYLNDDD